MKNLLKGICLLTFFLFVKISFGQCTTDTVFVGGSPGVGMQTDTLSDPQLPCYGYNCKAVYCHSWQLPIGFNGHLELFSNTTLPLPINIQIWEGCHYVRWEGCRTVAQQSIMDWDTILDFPANCQIVVCNSNEPITIVIKPGPATDTLPTAFLYVDTLCGGLVPIDPIKETPEKFYYELEEVIQAGMTGIRPKVVAAGDRKPDCAYIRAKTPYIQ